MVRSDHRGSVFILIPGLVNKKLWKITGQSTISTEPFSIANCECLPEGKSSNWVFAWRVPSFTLDPSRNVFSEICPYNGSTAHWNGKSSHDWVVFMLLQYGWSKPALPYNGLYIPLCHIYYTRLWYIIFWYYMIIPYFLGGMHISSYISYLPCLFWPIFTARVGMPKVQLLMEPGFKQNVGVAHLSRVGGLKGFKRHGILNCALGPHEWFEIIAFGKFCHRF